tara:strand:- start:243 stop:719 length:477 start_codon:yes stop_codon:yes gene_type:complete
MALQSNGQISLSNISSEMNLIDSNLSLAGLSTHSTLNDASANKPNEVAPHVLTEFYSYDHSASSTPVLKMIMGSLPTTKYRDPGPDSCSYVPVNEYWHDGDSSIAMAGDKIYIDRDGTKPLGSGLMAQSSEEVSKVGAYITGSGIVEAVYLCEFGGKK